MDFGGARKRGRFDAPLNGNGGPKKFKQEMDSFSTGIGSKSKPCTKFFSTTGCPFGEGCHFLHYVPGGYKAASQMQSPALPPGSRNSGPPLSFPDGPAPAAVKTRLCTKYNSAGGCKFGDKCHFAHGEWELGRPSGPSFDDPRSMGPPMPGRMGGGGHQQSHGAAASFGASSTAKISVDASLCGVIIGKNGVNSKHICRVTGAKLSIRDHETDPNSRNIELEGTFDQIKQATAMVQDQIYNIRSAAGHGGGPGMGHGHGHGPGPGPMKAHGLSGGGPGNNFKTKICESFTKGACTFGDRCHFAHGAGELRKSGI